MLLWYPLHVNAYDGVTMVSDNELVRITVNARRERILYVDSDIVHARANTQMEIQRSRCITINPKCATSSPSLTEVAPFRHEKHCYARQLPEHILPPSSPAQKLEESNAQFSVRFA